MSQISRMYVSHARANEAAEALRNRGPEIYFRDVFVVSADRDPAREAGAPPPAGEAVAALTALQVPGAIAQVYAEGIRRGHAVVTVHAPFGCGRTAIGVLEDFGPIDPGIDEDRVTVPSEERATPLSSLLGWRVLLDDPAPLSRLFGLPVLARRNATARLDSPERARPSGPYRPVVPMPTLSRNPAWLSSKLGLSTLSRNPAPLSSKLGMPVLSHNPAPLSSKLGMPVLSRNPAPLSSMLGLPLLTRSQR